MSHISTTNINDRVLRPDVPPSSLNFGNRPPPLVLVPDGTAEQETASSKGFWFFKRNHRNGLKSPTSSKFKAPAMARSLSEPNSPTDPTSAATAGRQKAGEKLNYIAMALQLLKESKVRFDGHEKDWVKFNDRYHQLFAMGQPIHGKIVKYNTPKPNAQDVAKLLVRDIQAKLEELDAEMEILDSEDSSSTIRLKRDLRRAFASTPEPVTGPPSMPWSNLKAVNPAILDKVNKHRSINPEGTWHGQSRSRSAVPSRQMPDFSSYDPRNKNGRRTGSEAGISNPTYEIQDLVREGQVQTPKEAGERENKKDREPGRDRRREGEREKDRGKSDPYARERERGDSDRDKPRDKDGYREWGDGGPDRGRKDRHRHRRDNTPQLEYPPRPASAGRERQMSDPAIYTRSSHRRNPSPESLAPAIYTLAEDVEVREGTSSVSSRDPVPRAVPRIPTVVAYPGNEEEELNNVYGNGGRNGPNEGDRHRSEPVSFRTPDPVSDGGGTSGPISGPPHRRRRRSRSLGHELDGRGSRNHPRSRSPKKDRMRDKEWEGGRDRQRNRERHGERDKERDGDRDKNGGGEERERGGGGEKEKDRDREKEKDRDKPKDNDREKERYRDRGKDKDKNKNREKDVERDREREVYKHVSARPLYQEGELGRYDSRNRRNRERDRDRDRDRERDRDKERPREKGGNKERERERDKEQDLDKERNRDREREYDSHRPEGGQPENTSSALPTQAHYLTGVQGSSWLAPPSGLAPLSLHPIFKPGVAPTGPFPPNPDSESRFLEILTSPAPPMPYNLPGPK